MSQEEYTKGQDEKIRRFIFITGVVLEEIKTLIPNDPALKMALVDVFLKMGDFCRSMDEYSKANAVVQDET